MSTHNPNPVERTDVRSEIVERLRDLRWPEPTPEARRRCWELLSAQLGDVAEQPDPRAIDQDEDHAAIAREPKDELHERRLRRHEFAKQVCQGYAGALGARVAATHGVSRARLS